MTRIYQQSPDSCMAACVASLIGCEFEDVPTCFHGKTWDHFKQREWLADRHGLGMAEHKLTPDSMWPPTPGMLCIVSGKSPRGDYRHAVVCTTNYDTAGPFKVVHDPFRADVNLWHSLDGEPEIVTWLIPLTQQRPPADAGGGEE